MLVALLSWRIAPQVPLPRSGLNWILDCWLLIAGMYVVCHMVWWQLVFEQKVSSQELSFVVLGCCQSVCLDLKSIETLWCVALYTLRMPCFEACVWVFDNLKCWAHLYQLHIFLNCPSMGNLWADYRQFVSTRVIGLLRSPIVLILLCYISSQCSHIMSFATI